MAETQSNVKLDGFRSRVSSFLRVWRVLIERNSLSVDDNICSPMGVELSGEGIAGRR